MKKLNPRIVWAVFFAMVNLTSGIIIWRTRGFLGETAGIRLDDRNVVPWVTLLVAVSYLIPLLLVFPVMTKIRVRSISFSRKEVGSLVGFFCFVLQLAYMLFFIRAGVGVAGSMARSNSLMSVFWVLVGVDPLLVVYYGFYRSSRWFLPNLIASVISNTLRGWSGIFIVVIFMESARLMRSGKLRMSHLVLIAVTVLVGYPLVWSLKWQARLISSGGVDATTMATAIVNVASSLGPSGFLDVLKLSLLSLFARLHIVSNVVVVFQNAHLLSSWISQGRVNPFWREGVPGLVLDRLSGVRGLDLGGALAQIIDPNADVTWNSNPGYVGWFFVMPWLTPLYLLYTALLTWISMYLVRKFRKDTFSLDMLWFAWCFYLVPGWIAAFIIFIFALLVFYALHFLADLVLKWKELLLVRPGKANELKASP